MMKHILSEINNCENMVQGPGVRGSHLLAPVTVVRFFRGMRPFCVRRPGRAVGRGRHRKARVPRMGGCEKAPGVSVKIRTCWDTSASGYDST